MELRVLLGAEKWDLVQSPEEWSLAETSGMGDWCWEC
jgi:hypothetical protein